MLIYILKMFFLKKISRKFLLNFFFTLIIGDLRDQSLADLKKHDLVIFSFLLVAR